MREFPWTARQWQTISWKPSKMGPPNLQLRMLLQQVSLLPLMHRVLIIAAILPAEHDTMVS